MRILEKAQGQRLEVAPKLAPIAIAPDPARYSGKDIFIEMCLN